MKLYRGVSVALYEKLGGKLTPKQVGCEFSSVVGIGQEHAVCGNGFIIGKCATNSVLLHQWKQSGLPTSGVSFTPHLDRAQFYASMGKNDGTGYIYVIETENLDTNGVKKYSVNEFFKNPAVPEDNEYILVANDYGTIPDKVIVELIK